MDCARSFSINHKRKKPVLWIPHIDGIPYRKLADEHGLSHAQVYARVIEEMDQLPTNTRLTYDYCNRFCGILVVDGKYVKVKGYKQKIPFVYGIDYLTHDIPVGVLVPSESEEAFRKFFRLIKTCSYTLRVVVCDDVVSSLQYGLFYHYPKAKIQLCNNHYIENIRQLLHIRSQNNHVKFFNTIYKHIFTEHKDRQQLNNLLHHMVSTQAKKDIVRQQIVMDIHKRREELFAYKQIPNCPKDTNLIELFNSHMNARLRAIKGFQSLQSAKRWLNAYIIRRRTKPFTDCAGRFKHLNGKTSLEKTIKKRTDLSEIIAKYQLETER